MVYGHIYGAKTSAVAGLVDQWQGPGCMVEDRICWIQATRHLNYPSPQHGDPSMLQLIKTGTTTWAFSWRTSIPFLPLWDRKLLFWLCTRCGRAGQLQRRYITKYIRK